MIFRNVKVFTKEFKFETKDVVVENGKFGGENKGEEIDAKGLMMWPGLIDIHTHGAMGYDNMDIGFEAQYEIRNFMAKNGVTTFVPTIMTNSPDALIAAAKNIKDFDCKEKKVAKVGAIHTEGPYFSLKYKGAQPEEYIKNPSLHEMEKLYEASGGLLKLISLAPERDGAIDFIKEASKKYKIAIGHTDSDYETAKKAIQNGATVLTHTFNAMRGLHHREPNAICAALLSENVMCECICDGMHVHPAMVKLLYNIVGKERLVIISDSLRSAGLDDGVYTMADGRKIIVKDSLARLEDGTIAGSSAKLYDCVVKAVLFGIPIEDAIRCASFNSAKAVGIEDIAGVIDEDRAADFLLVDENLNLVDVYIDGTKVEQ